jgi:DNA-binding GntR family transcriptional regulator
MGKAPGHGVRSLSRKGPITDGDHIVRHRTAQAAVAARLRSEILRGVYEPGERLLQNDVAERFQTSTTPVREALRQLVAEGLLDGDPHRGVQVHPATMDELEQIYEIRMALEPIAAAATVANATPDDVSRAKVLTEAMKAEPDPGHWVTLNGEFHRLLVEAAGRPRLTTILENLRNLSALYVATSIHEAPSRVEAGNAEHDELLAAIDAGDVAAAQQVTRRHLEHTLELGKLFLQGR